MSITQPIDYSVTSVARLPATSQQRRSLLVVTLILLAAFAVTAPLAAMPLARLDSFIPTVEGIIFVDDLITSILLFAQHLVVPSRAILALASGYLFTALTIVAHVLTFPGAFAPSGLMGAGLQTAPWLYFFWHFGFPVAVLAYAAFGRRDNSSKPAPRSAASNVRRCVAFVVGLVAGLLWLATAGERLLPLIFVDSVHVDQTNLFVINTLNVAVVASALAILWFRRSSLLDYWLMLVLLAMASELVTSNMLNSFRFSLGYYAGRAFSLATSIFVLAWLLEEMIKSYARVVHANTVLERERRNRLMNIEATTAAIAHEIKQPLTAILGNAQAALVLLKKAPSDLSEVQEALNDIVADGLRTGEALDGVRALFRRANQSRELVDMNEVALEVLHASRAELGNHGIIVRPELAPAIPLIHGNRGQLQQVIFNLVHNAVEAMGATADRSRVLRVTTQRLDPGAIAVAVQDSGPGIDPLRLDGLFDALETTKSQGMGLGLAICRVFIERHGGRLSAHSDGKGGALFQFVLPLQSPDDASADA